MAVTQGASGDCVILEDFLTRFDVNSSTSTTTFVPGTGQFNIGQVGYCSVNEGTIGYTVDEANGVLAITTDVGDDDNAALYTGVAIPNVNGTLIHESRSKFDSATLSSLFVGFSETLSIATPVMPIEFATTTMTYNGTGQILGALLDIDATTDDFRATAGDAAVVVGTNASTRAALVSAGIRATETITADEWYIVRVELSQDGVGEVWVGHKNRGLDLILRVTALPVVNALYFLSMFENRSAAARIWEVDYIYSKFARDWEVT